MVAIRATVFLTAQPGPESLQNGFVDVKGGVGVFDILVEGLLVTVLLGSNVVLVHSIDTLI